MIKYFTMDQFKAAQKKFAYKFHAHQEDNIFLTSAAPEYLNPRAYKLCRLCGQIKILIIDETIDKEIKEVIYQKKQSQTK